MNIAGYRKKIRSLQNERNSLKERNIELEYANEQLNGELEKLTKAKKATKKRKSSKAEE